MKLTQLPEIAALFALAKTFSATRVQSWPIYATPKMNGVRALWVPGAGFFSRDGVAYFGGTLPHIEAELKDCTLWLDGEFYKHGMSLQQINSRAGVVRQTPHSDYQSIQFHAFDLVNHPDNFYGRQTTLAGWCGRCQHVIPVDYRLVKCMSKANAAHDAYVSMGYEGTVYKSEGKYQSGSSTMMLKRKAWQDDDFEVVRLVPGTGKYEGSMGAVVLKNSAGVEFEVGSFAITDAERLEIFYGPKPAQAKVQYLGLTDLKRPYNSQVLAFL